VDQDFTDVGVEIIADRADDETRFLVDQVRARLQFCGVLDRMPELHQVVQVPLQFFGRTPDARRAGDNAHSARNFERADCLTELVAFFALHPPRYAAAAWVVR